MKRLCMLALGCALLAAPGGAQTPQQTADQKALADIQARMNAAPNTALPPVSTLTCAQMVAELGAAGSKMSSQLDPSLAANAQALQDQIRSGTPQPATQAQVAENHARINQIGGQVAGAMQGIDLQRMMALSDAFSAKGCKTPQ